MSRSVYRSVYVPSTCLGCGDVIANGTRCKDCARAYEAGRSKLRAAYRDVGYRSIPLGGMCHICGEPGSDTRDHVVRLRDGGTNDPSNIRPAHRACNSAKG